MGILIRFKYACDLKLGLIILLFFISIFYFIVITIYSALFYNVVWDKAALGIPLVLAIGFLWIQEVGNKKVLRKTRVKFTALQSIVITSNLQTIKSLVLAEETKDHYTKGHSVRMTNYASLVAKKLGFSPERLKVLETASVLHDLGKMGLADVILHKKGPLNRNEWELVKKHPDMAVEILSPLKFLSEEKKIIKHHHERYDGKGYPDGIKGDEIPIGARILAVVDSFDAMRTNRPYRAQLQMEVVISRLKNNAGTQFDPKIVKVFLELLGKDIV